MGGAGGVSRAAGGLRRPGVLAWLRLARAFGKVQRSGEEHLRHFGLNMGQFDVLAHVGASEGMSQGKLADTLLVSKGNVAQLIRKMEDRGLVLRCSEGRMKRLYLTDAGRELYERAVPSHEDMIQARFDVLPEDEQRTLYELLRKLDLGLDPGLDPGPDPERK